MTKFQQYLKNVHFLTIRETEVVQELFRTGDAHKVIAENLKIHLKTVKFHFRNSYSKLDVTNRSQLLFKYARVYNSLKEVVQ